MKTLILAATLIMGLTAHAQKEVIISKKNVKLEVDLSTAGIRSSNAGYGDTFFVKILVPGLAEQTVLNHRNEGEAAPCLATYDTYNIEDVVQGNPSKEIHDFEIVQKKVLYPNAAGKTCVVYLVEKVETTVRGFRFLHERSSGLPKRHIDDCQ